jgi:hypothetical protein
MDRFDAGLPSMSAPLSSLLFSKDYYVRLTTRKLETIALTHLCTMQDPAVLADISDLGTSWRKAGITEWQGLQDGIAISLGWDWALLEDGSVRMLTVVPPRTNMLVLDAKGYDMPALQAACCFWDLIRTLPWQAEVATALRSEPAQALPRTH